MTHLILPILMTLYLFFSGQKLRKKSCPSSVGHLVGGAALVRGGRQDHKVEQECTGTKSGEIFGDIFKCQ